MRLYKGQFWPCFQSFYRGGGSEISEESIISAASFKPVAELLQVGNSVEMDEGCCHHKHVEYLVGMKLGKRETQV